MIEIEIDYREKKIIDLLTVDKINIKTKKDKKDELNIKTKNLDIGDIILNIKKKDIVLFTYLIERKSISDMLASVKDGRYKEQKLRLKHNKNRLDKENIPNNYFYILEGTNDKLNKDELKLLYGSWISTTFRDNINIIRVMNVEETIKFIIRLIERMYKDKKEFINSNIKTIILSDKNNKNNEGLLEQKHLKDNKISLENKNTLETTTKTIITNDNNLRKTKEKSLLELSKNEKNNLKYNNLDDLDNNNLNKLNKNNLEENIISNTNEREYLDSLASGIKKKKKENLTSNVCQNMMLCQIPGIQTNISTQIINHFGSLSKLLIYLNNFSSNNENTENNNNENDNELLIKNLSEIKIKTNTGKERKLGKSIANNIIDFLL
jgi:ERCC4-type nuclease